MAFDYERARTAQQRYIDQSVASRIDAETQRRLADEARQRGDLGAQRDHMARAAAHDEQRAKLDALTQDMQRQMQAAYETERREAPEKDQVKETLERQLARDREIEAAEQARVTAEEGRQQREAERDAAEQARQKADEQRLSNADQVLKEAADRAAQIKRDRGDDGRER